MRQAGIGQRGIVLRKDQLPPEADAARFSAVSNGMEFLPPGQALKTLRKRYIAKFREKFIRILLSDKSDYARLLDKLIADVAKYPVAVVHGRSPKRKTPRKKRFFQARRAVV